MTHILECYLRSRRSRQRGMTLMELLVAVIILGVLTAIAVPSYRRYLVRAQRSDATTALLRLQASQEKHFLQYGVYVLVTDDLPKSHADGGLGMAVVSERGFYDIEVTDTDTGYTATATPIAGGGQAEDSTCAEFSITEAGTKRSENASGTDTTTACFR